MIQLPVTPANLPVDWSGWATNSAIQAASTTREPSGRMSRMVSVKVPGWLAPWSVRPYQHDQLLPMPAEERERRPAAELARDGPVMLILSGVGLNGPLAVMQTELGRHANDPVRTWVLAGKW